MRPSKVQAPGVEQQPPAPSVPLSPLAAEAKCRYLHPALGWAILRSVSMRPRLRYGLVLLLGPVLLASAIGAYVHHRGRTVLLGEQRGDARLVAVHSVRLRSATVEPDGRRVRVTYVGGYDGCGDFASLRVTEHRGNIGVRVQLGNVPASRGAICNLGGREYTRSVLLCHVIPTRTRVQQVL
jgi:hypothetical protein